VELVEVIQSLQTKKIEIIMKMKLLTLRVKKEEVAEVLNIQLMNLSISKMMKKRVLLTIWNIKTIHKVNQNLMKIQMKPVIILNRRKNKK
jgi:hypothetical protein